MLKLKEFAKTLFRRAGYHVERIDPTPESFKAQRQALSDRDVRAILDVGANAGQTAKMYRGLFPTATIHSFEPTPEVFVALSETFAGDSRVVPHNLALADEPGRLEFHICKGSQLNSLLSVAPDGPTHMGGRSAEEVGLIEVEATTLDQFCASEGLDHINILKMDVQGGELLVLRGGERMLRNHAIDLVYSEVQFADLYDGQAGFDRIWRHLGAFEYSLFNLFNLTTGSNRMLGEGDAIFLSPAVAESVATRWREAVRSYKSQHGQLVHF